MNSVEMGRKRRMEKSATKSFVSSLPFETLTNENAAPAEGGAEKEKKEVKGGKHSCVKLMDSSVINDDTDQAEAPLLSSNSTVSTNETKLPIWLKILYGFPNLPFCLASNFFSVYAFKYYTDYVHVKLQLINIAYIFTLLSLLLSFPILGWLLDRTETRWGRRKPWLVMGAPLYFCSTILIFWAPSRPSFLESFVNEQLFGAVYFVLTYGSSVMLTYIVLSPYYGLGVELTADFEERSSLFGYSQAFYIVGVVVSTSFPEFLLKWFPDARNVFVLFTLSTAVLGVISFEILCFVITERKSERLESMPLVSGMRFSILENRPFFILLLAATIINAAPWTLGLLPFWVQVLANCALSA
jgi:Na+/melibiose symporter-like transporter